MGECHQPRYCGPESIFDEQSCQPDQSLGQQPARVVLHHADRLSSQRLWRLSRCAHAVLQDHRHRSGFAELRSQPE